MLFYLFEIRYCSLYKYTLGQFWVRGTTVAYIYGHMIWLLLFRLSSLSRGRWCHLIHSLTHSPIHPWHNNNCHLRSTMETIWFHFMLFYLGESSSSPDPLLLHKCEAATNVCLLLFSQLYQQRFSIFGLSELIGDINAGSEGQKAGARLLSIIDDPHPYGKIVSSNFVLLVLPIIYYNCTFFCCLLHYYIHRKFVLIYSK